MNLYTFYGRVIPERTMVNFRGLGWTEFVQPDSDLHFQIKIDINLSIITVFVKSEDQIQDTVTLKNYVSNMVSLFVDCIGFSNGCSYNIEIDSCTYNDGEDTQVFGVQISELTDTNAYDVTIVLMSAYFVANSTQKMQLQRSLEELKMGIKLPHDTAFHAYRAIESIRQSFASWEEMNENLNLNQSYTRQLKEDHADLQRHGTYTFMTSDQRTEMLLKSKTIINRFVKYIQNGNRRLSLTDQKVLA